MSDTQARRPSAMPLNATALKLIAAAAMLIDHIAWYWFPLDAAPGFILHLIGRLTAPVMCYLIAEGYYKTRNVVRYALRLLIFAVLAQIPYTYYLTGRVAFIVLLPGAGYAGSLNVMFTLLLGLIALRAMDCKKLPRPARIILAALCCIASFPCDWSLLGVLFVLVFGVRHDDFKYTAAIYGLTCGVLLLLEYQSYGWSGMYQAGMLLAIPLLYLYNGKRGAPASGPRAAIAKYAFYAYYPLHMLILAVIRGR